MEIPQSRQVDPAGITRRQFLEGTLAVAVTGATAASLRAAEHARISLGYSLYGMKSLTLSNAISECSKIGYAHVEFALLEGYPTYPESFTTGLRRDVRQQLKSLRMELPSLMLNLSLVTDDATHARSLKLIGQAGAMAHELSPDKPPIIETVLGGKPHEWDQQKAGMVAKLGDWVRAADAAHVVIAVKAHVAQAVNSPERLLWLLDQVKSEAVQVVYDYSHFEVQGIGMEESLTALLPRTRLVHVKDVTGTALKFQFLLPGDGQTDYVKLFRLLKQHRYAGPVCAEVSGQIFNKPGFDPASAAKHVFQKLAKPLAESES